MSTGNEDQNIALLKGKKPCNMCRKIGHFPQMGYTKEMTTVHDIDLVDDQIPYFCCTEENHRDNHTLIENHMVDDHMIDAEEFETCFHDSIKCDFRGLAWKVILHLDNSIVTFKLDSGADVSVMGHLYLCKHTLMST